MSFSACTPFEELNKNPDTSSDASASLLCTQVVLSITKFNGVDAKVMVSANALSKYVGYANEGQLDAQYNKIGSSSFDGMLVLSDIDRMLEYAEGTAAENSYKGIAKFARARVFYALTMQMGDIPYSQTNQGADAVYKPTYDSQLDVLVGVLNELEEASSYFADGYQFTGDPTPYNGDPEKWRRATNAFELQVLLSLSEKTDITDLDVVNRFRNIVSEGYLLEESTGFYGLEYSDLNRHPLSGTNPIFTSKTIISSLLLDNLKALNDRRFYYFGEPAGAQIDNGWTETDPEAYVGVDVEMDYSEMNAGHSNNEYSLLNYRYLQEYATEPRILMSFAEQQFILAEARILGWITQGTAREYYESGVRSALAQTMKVNSAYAHGMAIDQDYIDGYFTGEAVFKATDQEQLEQVWMQKYFINFMQDPRTSFFEYRRTGFPDFPINPATSLNVEAPEKIPMRWLYPSSESTLNRENLVEALDRQYDGYDEINKIMWLLQ